MDGQLARRGKDPRDGWLLAKNKNGLLDVVRSSEMAY
jgi:hypothetical protein